MAQVTYHVIGNGITTETQLNAGGTGIEDVHVVPYVIDSGPASGTRRTVKVPAAMFNTAGVKAAIESDANNTHDVASISTSGKSALWARYSAG